MRFLIRDQLYVFQLLEYDPVRFLSWVIRHPFKFNLEKKNRLAFTGKTRYLILSSSLIFFTLLGFSFRGSRDPSQLLLSSSATILSFLFLPWLYLTSSALILKIYEMPNRLLTTDRAKKILQENKKLTIIAITGSYGKTSVKEILAQILSKKFKVLATPQSYNTLFGITPIIKEKLKPEHEIFIVEMGAYRTGEIAELCRMVKPKIGILTGISNQHLERFGSEENIIRAKYELIESLPADGLGVFNLDSKPSKNLFEKTSIDKIGYSLQPDRAADLSAAIITADAHVTVFDVKDQPSMRSPKGRLLLKENPAGNFTINLPGEHNVSNSLAAIAVALYLNVSIEKIREALAEVKSPAHRLQVTTNAQGTVIIDDAYSGNTEGAKVAVNLVKKFPNRPKIIVTPGIVELGPVQFEENKNLGKRIAENFDFAVIVNKTNRRALLEGILSGSEPRWFLAKPGASLVSENKINQVFTADSLEDATKNIIPYVTQPGALILFENDLPDIYD